MCSLFFEIYKQIVNYNYRLSLIYDKISKDIFRLFFIDNDGGFLLWLMLSTNA